MKLEHMCIATACVAFGCRVRRSRWPRCSRDDRSRCQALPTEEAEFSQPWFDPSLRGMSSMCILRIGDQRRRHFAELFDEITPLTASRNRPRGATERPVRASKVATLTFGWRMPLGSAVAETVSRESVGITPYVHAAQNHKRLVSWRHSLDDAIHGMSAQRDAGVSSTRTTRSDGDVYY